MIFPKLRSEKVARLNSLRAKTLVANVLYVLFTAELPEYAEKMLKHNIYKLC